MTRCAKEEEDGGGELRELNATGENRMFKELNDASYDHRWVDDVTQYPALDQDDMVLGSRSAMVDTNLPADNRWYEHSSWSNEDDKVARLGK